MRKLLFLTALLACALAPSSVRAQCIGVGGVNSVPQNGVVCLSEPSVATFMAAGYGIVPAASATDVACLTGSTTRVVRVQAIRVSGTAGTLVTLPVLINKHTVANTGGTAAVTTALPVPVPLDSALAAATATTTAYTANPTVDATAAQLNTQTVSFNTTSALATGPAAFFNWTDRSYMTALTLRGVAQQVCVNLGGISVSSGLLAIAFTWTESPQ